VSRNIEIKARDLDEVEGLGAFLELEVVLRPEQSPSEGRRTARELMARLEIEEGDLVGQAYIDLLENRSS
jgi:adenylate cyclase class IV